VCGVCVLCVSCMPCLLLVYAKNHIHRPYIDFVWCLGWAQGLYGPLDGIYGVDSPGFGPRAPTKHQKQRHTHLIIISVCVLVLLPTLRRRVAYFKYLKSINAVYLGHPPSKILEGAAGSGVKWKPKFLGKGISR